MRSRCPSDPLSAMDARTAASESVSRAAGGHRRGFRQCRRARRRWLPDRPVRDADRLPRVPGWRRSRIPRATRCRVAPRSVWRQQSNPSVENGSIVDDDPLRRRLGSPARPQLAELGLRVVERRPAVREVRFRLRVDDQAPAALLAEERPAIAPRACAAGARRAPVPRSTVSRTPARRRGCGTACFTYRPSALDRPSVKRLETEKVLDWSP